ncbi:MAG TPA: Crp/Fnr family transcriptional regulator, partial [Bacteroidia bacterium]
KKEFSKNLEGLNKFMSDVKSEVELKKLTVDQGVKYFKKKENIYLEGNYPRGIFFISKGKVKTYKTNEQGKELITGLLKEGEFFGYLALFEEKQYSDSAEALENSEISLISKDDFQELVYKNSEVSRKFLKMLSDDLHEKENQLINLAYNSVRKRIAESLLVLCSRFKKENQQNIIMNISREDIANLAGTATETTIRTLGDFDEEGLIEISGKTIAVKNYQMLERMKN